jgi:hypothetical protein
VLQKLIFDREPTTVLSFAESVSKWGFKRVLPAHLKTDVPCNAKQFRRAFGFLEGGRGDYACNLEALPLSGDAR